VVLYAEQQAILFEEEKGARWKRRSQGKFVLASVGGIELGYMKGPCSSKRTTCERVRSLITDEDGRKGYP